MVQVYTHLPGGDGSIGPQRCIAMSAPTTITTAPPCALDKESVMAYLHTLRPQDGGAWADAILSLAATVRARQIEIAGQEWEQCRLWTDGAGQWGIYNKDGRLRRVQRAYARDSRNKPTHWHVSTPYSSVIATINLRLSEVSRRYPQREGQVRSVRPQPKHYYILRWLRMAEQQENNPHAVEGVGATAELVSFA